MKMWIMEGEFNKTCVHMIFIMGIVVAVLATLNIIANGFKYDWVYGVFAI